MTVRGTPCRFKRVALGGAGQHLEAESSAARKEISCLGGGLDFRPLREWTRWLERPKWPGRRAAVGGGREEEGDDMKERGEEWGQP